MKHHLQYLLCIIGILASSQTSLAQPANDNPCNFQILIVDDPAISADNTGATVDPGEVVPPPGSGPDPCFNAWCNADQEAQNTSWFQFTAPANGAVVITTCLEGTSFDTQLALWQVSDCDDYSTFQFVAANDDMPNSCDLGDQYASTLVVDGLLSGEIYFLEVDGFDGGSGNYELQISTGIPMALVNFIHNSADQTINIVDIRVNGELIADDIAYQSCTGYIDVPANNDAYITINDAASSDDSQPLHSLDYNFNSSVNYVATVDGISSPTGYSPNPSLSLEIFSGAQLFSQVPGILPLLFFHGITDGPTVDISNVESASLINDNLQSGNYSSEGYVNVVAENFSLSLTDENGNDLGLTFCMPLSGAAQFGAAFTIVASGFVIPGNNSDGMPAGLYVANHFNGEFIALESGLCDFPDNDDVCNPANLIINDAPVNFDNSLAGVQEGESSPLNLFNDDPEADCITQWCDGSLDATLWFTFTAPASGSVLVTTCFEITFDTQIAICQIGDCNDFSTVTYLATNDDMEGGCEGGDNYASNLIYSGLTPGTVYHIQLDGWEGSNGPFDIQVLDLLSVNSESKNTISIFPNPANNLITINGINANTDIEIRDVTGKLFYTARIQNNYSIDVHSLAAGLYTMSLKSDEQTNSQLIIIE